MSFKTIVKLGDICDVRDGTHDSPKPKLSGHPLVTSKHIKNGLIDFCSANLISADDFESINKRSKVDKFDVLISMIGTVGELVFVGKQPEYAIKNIGLIKTGGNELLGNYLYYYLKSPQAKNHLSSVLAGSTQKFIGLGELRKFPIELWDESSQKKIVKILGDLDRKIELNRRMNETLEQIGQELFKYYFIDNPEREEWKVTTYGEHFQLERGLSYKGMFLDEKEGVPMVNLGNFSVSGEYSPKGIKYYTGEYKDKNIVKSGDLVMANTDITQQRTVLGSVLVVPDLGKKILYSHHVNAIRSKGAIPNSFVYFALKQPAFRQRAQGFATGTTVLALPREAFTECPLYMPNGDLLSKFAAVADNLLKRKELLRKEVISLSNTRELILPKLFSGQISV